MKEILIRRQPVSILFLHLGIQVGSWNHFHVISMAEVSVGEKAKMRREFFLLQQKLTHATHMEILSTSHLNSKMEKQDGHGLSAY